MRHTLRILVAVLWLAAGMPALAQSGGRVATIGLVSNLQPSDPGGVQLRQAMINGLGERGWQLGRNLVIETRFTGGRAERFADLTAELVTLGVDVIVATNSQATAAAKAKTSTIPIVMLDVSHPVEAGFVASLARPGGNVTGLTNQFSDSDGKYIELLREFVPTLDRLALLYSPSNAGSALGAKGQEEAGQRLGVSVAPLPFDKTDDLEAAFALIDRMQPQALRIHPTPVLAANRAAIIKGANERRLPTITAFRFYVLDGALMAFGPSQADSYRRAATFIDRILRGASPADLPVEQPTKFELVINGKTAKTLGIEIPPTLLARADEVIE